jgi:hypothetical protein
MKTRRKPTELPLEKLAEEALKEAVAEVIAEHKSTGHPPAVWKDGQVFHLPPDEIEVRDVHMRYKASLRKRK